MKKTQKIFTKFTKKSEDITEIKKDFFLNNDKLLKKNLTVINFLKKQKKRYFCKNCGNKLNNKIDYISHSMGYKICLKCSHLNSCNNDSSKFHKTIYNDNKFSYSSNYINSYTKRVKKIYTPKANFINDFAKKYSLKNINLLDIGTGCGHFVYACRKMKINAFGIDSNLQMIKVGKKLIKNNYLRHVNSLDETLKLIKYGNYTFVSLVAVLEHLEKPNDIFKNFYLSKNKYLFISIPLFSLSVYIDIIFQNVYPRHTAASHPHIYTYESIKYILKKNKLKICGEWWFGTDFMDINRSMTISLGKNKSSKFIENFNKNFSKNIDAFQEILDKKKLSSEVHLIIKKI